MSTPAISALLTSALLISALLIRNVAERWRSSLVAALCGALLLAGCASSSSTGAAGTDAPTTSIADDADGTATSNGAADDLDLFDSGEVHDISVDFDQADYEAMIATFVSTGEKEWISATVTLDGVTYENVGLRLKGNSSLFGLSTETSGSSPWCLSRLSSGIGSPKCRVNFTSECGSSFWPGNTST